jgi:hypothetical protein
LFNHVVHNISLALNSQPLGLRNWRPCETARSLKPVRQKRSVLHGANAVG